MSSSSRRSFSPAAMWLTGHPGYDATMYQRYGADNICYMCGKSISEEIGESHIAQHLHQSIIAYPIMWQTLDLAIPSNHPENIPIAIYPCWASHVKNEFDQKCTKYVPTYEKTEHYHGVRLNTDLLLNLTQDTMSADEFIEKHNGILGVFCYKYEDWINTPRLDMFGLEKCAELLKLYRGYQNDWECVHNHLGLEHNSRLCNHVINALSVPDRVKTYIRKTTEKEYNWNIAHCMMHLPDDMKSANHLDDLSVVSPQYLKISNSTPFINSRYDLIEYMRLQHNITSSSTDSELDAFIANISRVKNYAKKMTKQTY